jgi:hypothetical protein
MRTVSECRCRSPSGTETVRLIRDQAAIGAFLARRVAVAHLGTNGIAYGERKVHDRDGFVPQVRLCGACVEWDGWGS